MDELMTMEEIEATYDGEWVLLADVESDAGPVFRRGRVMWHSKDQDECWAKVTDVHSSLVAVLYCGDWSAEDEPVPML